MERDGLDTSGSVFEQKVVAFAQELGRLVGTIESRTDRFDRKTLDASLKRVRDEATDLLKEMTGGYPEADDEEPEDSQGRSGGFGQIQN